jgi:hypothetical protein
MSVLFETNKLSKKTLPSGIEGVGSLFGCGSCVREREATGNSERGGSVGVFTFAVAWDQKGSTLELTNSATDRDLLLRLRFRVAHEQAGVKRHRRSCENFSLFPFFDSPGLVISD